MSQGCHIKLCLKMYTNKAQIRPKNKLKQFVTKFGILGGLLPFIGKIKKWKYFLTSICKESNTVWRKYKHAFNELYKRTEWGDFVEEIQYFSFKYLNKTIDDIKNLSLSLYCDHNMHINFIKETNKYWFPSYKQLKVYYLNKIEDQHVDDLNKFLQQQRDIDELELNGWSDYISIEKFGIGLNVGLQAVTNTIIIWGFTLTQDSLKLIIESSYKVRKLSIILGKVASLTSGFELDDRIDYKINCLNLKHTLQKYESEYLNRTKLEILLKSMKPTMLVNTLTDVIAIDKQYDSDDLADIFDEYGFNVLCHQ